MNYKEVMELTQWLEKSAFTQYTISIGGVHVSMSKQKYDPQGMFSAGGWTSAFPLHPSPSMPAAEEAPISAMTLPTEAPKSRPGGHIIASPIVGTFYESSGPDKPPFVKAGQPVKEGDVLCVLEAMKIMNEITADTDGIIAEILVENGEMVEARQPLFRIEV
ncbi:MAG: acetyl-CoA carboxylase biotin carboxyl carrier protein [Clostridiales bacterium]|jgi:acetyl-CoA carboxylase biotin carboxyl carrier protein|nr:acetyl-CoA carboxylase biotin carboxyl carrier protein [Clostridiales bacterium]